MNWYRFAKADAVWLTGILKRTRKDFYYISVPGTIVSSFQTIIGPDKLLHPKDKWDNFVGAHISVFYGNEIEGKNITELGKEFEYKVTGLQSATPDGKGYDVYFIAVDSPQLEALRKKYDLPALINKESFHITVGIDE